MRLMMKILPALMLLFGSLILSACAVSAEYPKDQRPSHVIAGSTLSSNIGKDSVAPRSLKEQDDICTNEENCTCSRM